MLDPMRNDGVPSVLFSKYRRIKCTRKQHTCTICGGPIPVGSPALAYTTMTTDDKKPHTTYSHDGTSNCATGVVASGTWVQRTDEDGGCLDPFT